MAPYRRILLATDFSTAAERAYPLAAALAARDGATLLLAHAFDTAALAYEGPGLGEIPIQTLAEGELESRLNEGLKEVVRTRFSDLPAVETRLRLDGSPAHGLIQIATRERADLVVVSTHGRTGLGYMLIGSVAERVVRHAPCSVLVVPTKGREVTGLPKRVVVGSDLSPLADEALSAASALARAAGARTTLVHVQRPIPWVPPPSADADVAGAAVRTPSPLATLERSASEHFAGLEVGVTVLSSESTVSALCAEAEREKADLLVLASHGRTGLERMLVGSVAERTVRHAECPVLVVRRPRGA